MQWRGRHPFRPTDHMGDLHQFVVHHICKVVCREAVRFHEDRIVVDRLVRQVLFALRIAVSRLPVHQVLVFGVFLGSSKPYYVTFSSFDTLVGLLGRDVCTFPVIAQRQSLVVTQAVQTVDSFGRAEAPICCTILQQCLDVGGIEW